MSETKRKMAARAIGGVAVGAVGAAVGAGVEYLADPDRGRSRRARLAGQAGARARRTGRAAARQARYVRGRATGKMQARRAMHVPPVDDRELVQKIRSEVMGRAEFRELDIIIDAFGGVVHLRGAVSDAERAAALCAAVGEVEGVHAIENLLHAPGSAAPNKAQGLRSSQHAAGR
jgi:hypothetical protein